MTNFNELPERLTKEDFWNEMMEKYPVAMKRFCDWIDEYKNRVNWEFLFDHYYGFDENGKSRVKYHDLPVAMQIGIFLQFVGECNEKVGLKSSMLDLVGGIERFMKKTNKEPMQY